VRGVLEGFSVAFAAAAVICLLFAVAGMVGGHQSEVRGYLLRVGAVVCFGVAVALNVLAH
jgi:hypothetical protein